jgi:hypothetical protein
VLDSAVLLLCGQVSEQTVSDCLKQLSLDALMLPRGQRVLSSVHQCHSRVLHQLDLAAALQYR